MTKLILVDDKRTVVGGDYFLAEILGKTVLRQVIHAGGGDYFIIDPLEGRVSAKVDECTSAESAVQEYSGINGQVEIVEVEELRARKTGVKIYGGGK